MVEIKTIEEFNSIQKSDFGLVIVLKDNSKVIHKTKCNEINLDKFLETLESKYNVEYHWFSTVALAEKAYPNFTACENCKID